MAADDAPIGAAALAGQLTQVEAAFGCDATRDRAGPDPVADPGVRLVCGRLRLLGSSGLVSVGLWFARLVPDGRAVRDMFKE